MTHIYFIRHGDYIEDLENGSYQDLGLSPGSTPPMLIASCNTNEADEVGQAVHPPLRRKRWRLIR